MEGLLMAIVLLSALLGMYLCINWITGKFMGVKFHPRGAGEQARNTSNQEKSTLENYESQDIEEGIRRAKSKGFALTHENVLTEVRNAVRERGENPVEVESKNMLRNTMGVEWVSFDAKSKNVKSDSQEQ